MGDGIQPVEIREECDIARDVAVVGVDAKHRELVGEFKRPGATWEAEPALVLDHDFASDSSGVALLYGVYDVSANEACVSVGTTHDTPDFAVDNLARWWACHGPQRYPNPE